MMTLTDPSGAPSDLVIERMVGNWKRPAEAANSHEFRRNGLAASAVLELLLREFSLTAIRTAMEACLRQTADTQWQGASTIRRQNFATDCCLILARDVPSLPLTPELVQELVYKVDSVLGSTVLPPQIERHLSEAQLIDALALGVRTAKSEVPRASCLDGLGLYYRHVKRRSDIPSLQSSLQAFEHEVRRLRAQDVEHRGAVKSARKAAWAIRRKRAELPKPSVRQFIAYRDEQGESVAYLVQRRDDSELAIAISRLELTKRTLTIDYTCFDPELLPENAPDVIEASLLQVYAEDTYLTLADEVEFVDLQHKQTRRRRLSRTHRLV